MRFSVEAWSPEYGVGADDAMLEPTVADVDVDVEIAAARWHPILASPPLVEPARVCFVDGVRRIDARVWISEDDTARVGVCASVAAGVVVCEGSAALVERCEVVRGLFTPALRAQSIDTRYGTYRLFGAEDESPEKLYLAVHRQMTELERSVSEGIDGDLVIFDGPLRGRNEHGGVGYIKTQHVQYLPDELQPVVARLRTGERTPLFRIGNNGMTRWSWYFRLPGPDTQPLAGVVRCETLCTVDVDAAIVRANLVSTTLPRFASEPHKDGRAPQNLYPIAGLERELRRRLADAGLLERGLRVAARSAEPGSTANPEPVAATAAVGSLEG